MNYFSFLDEDEKERLTGLKVEDEQSDIEAREIPQEKEVLREVRLENQKIL